MKLLKSFKRKAGNAIVPVLGTILGLTILAGSVVGVALHSSNIVYKDSQLEKQNDGREILYMAAKYFAMELNSNVDEHTAATDTKAIFEFLEITKETKDGETKYYLWYPVDEAARKKAETVDDYTGQWYRATLQYSEGDASDDGSGTTQSELSDVMFRETAKLDEKFAIGNLMTVYLTDEQLLPGRTWKLNEISLVESDIDTFDEAYTYMNNSGVLLIDDIGVALYGYKANGDAKFTYIDNDDDYEIVYKTGNLGGNYYWQTYGGSDKQTWLYRQEYDLNTIYDTLCYKESDFKSNYSKSDIKYYYSDTYDWHYVKVKEGTEYVDYKVYHSTYEFATEISDYIFYQNIYKLALYLSDVAEKIDQIALENTWGNGYNNMYYEHHWQNSGLVVYVINSSGYYKEYTFNDTRLINAFKSISGNKYTDDSGNLDRNKILSVLRDGRIEQLVSESGYNQLKDKGITMDKINDKVFNKNNKWDITYSNSFKYTYTNVVNGREETKTSTLSYNSKYSTSEMDKAVADYLANYLVKKYTVGKIIKSQNNASYSLFTDDASKLIQDCQYQKDGNRMKISYHFNVLKDQINYHGHTWVGSNKIRNYDHQVQLDNFYSDQTGDTIYLSLDDVLKNFSVPVAKAFGYTVTVNVEEITTGVVTNLKEKLVEPIRYNYMPDSTYEKIFGLSSSSSSSTLSANGMKEYAVVNKLLTSYYAKNKVSNLAGDYNIKVKSVSFANENSLSNDLKQYINLNVTYDLTVGDSTSQQSITFLVKLLTWNGQNTRKTDGTNRYNANQDSETLLFSERVILNQSGDSLRTSNLSDLSKKVPAILTAIPFTERKKLVKYGTHIVTINGEDYTVTDSISDLTSQTIDHNILYNNSIESLGSDSAKITVADNVSLFINGDLNLVNDQDIELGKNAMLYVNGNLNILYEITKQFRYVERTWVDGYWEGWTYHMGHYEGGYYKANEYIEDDWTYFQSHGVDIDAAPNAKIIINGNLDYRGYKAKFLSGTNITIANDPSHSTYDLVYEQSILNTEFLSSSSCTIEGEGANASHTHYPIDAKSKLSGVYIVNGDVIFHAWDEEQISNKAINQWYAMYRNMYSNPLINATFYVDGTFDMRGLFTSSLYDPCRANFLFAKSIVEPALALNTALCQGENTQYGNWQDTNGYLFVIVEEAIDFSKVNFACVNMFTPFQELVAAINNNKASEFNFTEYISRDEFITMFPNSKVIDGWGLPSLIKQHLDKMYKPTDFGSIGIRDRIEGNDV